MYDPFGLIGTIIAQAIRVDQVIAEGGFGVVYKGFHQHFRAPVALKCLKVPGTASPISREMFLEQFRREAEIQFRLSSMTPHVVRPFHFGEVTHGSERPVPIMALEWLEGCTLSEHIARRQAAALPPMSLSDVLDLLGPAARAVHLGHHCEASGGPLTVVHRDLKPTNIFLAHAGGEQVVKVLDFGISKVEHFSPLLAGERTHTLDRPPFSPNYGAPEQWDPDTLGQTGPWTDVWGMALTLIEAIKGTPALDGGVQSIMFACLDAEKRPTPRRQGLTVSRPVDEVFEKALAVDPRHRYASVLDFWNDLRTALAKPGETIPDSFRARDQHPVFVPHLKTPRITLPTRPAPRRASPSSLFPPATLDLRCTPSSSLAVCTERAAFSWPPSEAP